MEEEVDESDLFHLIVMRNPSNPSNRPIQQISVQMVDARVNATAIATVDAIRVAADGPGAGVKVDQEIGDHDP